MEHDSSQDLCSQKKIIAICSNLYMYSEAWL